MKKEGEAQNGAPADAPGGREPTLFVGIDLGTSRTAIVSSRGSRHSLSTYVGRPKDVVSEKLFGKGFLFGDDALKNRLSLELFRPLAKGVIKSDGAARQENLDAVREFLRHTVTFAAPTQDDVVFGVVGAPAQASLRDKRALVQACEGLLDAVMIVSEPFCVAYGLDILTDALIVDIGAGTTDLCRMHGTLPGEDDQVTTDKAGDFIDQALFDLLKKTYPEAQFSLNMIKGVKENHGYVADAREKVEVVFPVKGKPTKFDISRELRAACEMIVPEMTQAMYQLIGSFDPEFQLKLRNNVLLCGGGSQLSGLRALVEKALDELGGGAVRIVDEPVYAGAGGALKIAQDMPASFWEHLS